jgi:hypothetical protein
MGKCRSASTGGRDSAKETYSAKKTFAPRKEEEGGRMQEGGEWEGSVHDGDCADGGVLEAEDELLSMRKRRREEDELQTLVVKYVSTMSGWRRGWASRMKKLCTGVSEALESWSEVHTARHETAKKLAAKFDVQIMVMREKQAFMEKCISSSRCEVEALSKQVEKLKSEVESMRAREAGREMRRDFR